MPGEQRARRRTPRRRSRARARSAGRRASRNRSCRPAERAVRACTRNAPAKPDMPADSANTASFVSRMLTPTVADAASLSRSAIKPPSERAAPERDDADRRRSRTPPSPGTGTTARRRSAKPKSCSVLDRAAPGHRRAHDCEKNTNSTSDANAIVASARYRPWSRIAGNASSAPIGMQIERGEQRPRRRCRARHRAGRTRRRRCPRTRAARATPGPAQPDERHERRARPAQCTCRARTG